MSSIELSHLRGGEEAISLHDRAIEYAPWSTTSSRLRFVCNTADTLMIERIVLRRQIAISTAPLYLSSPPVCLQALRGIVLIVVEDT